MSLPEIYISIDIETDGPAPGLNSMLSLGAAAFDQDGEEIGTWYAKLHPLEGAHQNAGTMQWWDGQQEAWAEVSKDRENTAEAIFDFCLWCETLKAGTGGDLVAVALPAAFDFAFVNYYCHRFTGRNPLGVDCLDIESYASGLGAGDGLSSMSGKRVRALAGKIDTADLRSHVALDDAIAQGRLFAALRSAALTRR